MKDWQPACDIQHLRLRAQMLANIRQFFADRQVMEVETPLLCHTTGTDPQLDFFATTLHSQPLPTPLFLQTSPEFAMKRLLAAGSGCIYQICKAFRNGESGRFHNPEFTMLEWYRVGHTLQRLMDEVAELLSRLLANTFSALCIKQLSYQQMFFDVTGLDALTFNRTDYRHYAQEAGFPEADSLCTDDHALWLDFIFSHCVQNAMLAEVIYLLYDYPAIQSSLARLNPDDTRTTQRFEVFINGIELGNGYFELTDSQEQSERFEREILYRQQSGLPLVTKDQRLLAALQTGLPDCSGVALGLDRLLLIVSGCTVLDNVLAFPIHRA